MAMISILTLREAIHYEPDTGLFHWKSRPIHHFKNGDLWDAEAIQKRWNTVYAGQPALNVRGKNGYLSGRVDDTRVLAHRAAVAWVEGSWPQDTVDHVNGDRTDNRIANLRHSDRTGQARNKAAHWNGTSQYLGVSLRKDRGLWRAVIFHEGRQHYLGSFKDEAEAARAYDEAAAKFFGEFARLNFP